MVWWRRILRSSSTCSTQRASYGRCECVSDDDDIRFLPEKENAPAKRRMSFSIIPSIAGGTPVAEAVAPASETELPTLSNDEIARLLTPSDSARGRDGWAAQAEGREGTVRGHRWTWRAAAYYLAAAGVERLAWSTSIRWMRATCSGRLSTRMDTVGMLKVDSAEIKLRASTLT